MTAGVPISRPRASRLIRQATVAVAALFVMATSARADYQLAVGDVIEVAVAGLPELRQRVPIQLDGTISVPILGTMIVADLTLSEVKAEVEAVLGKKMLRQAMPDGRERTIFIQSNDVAVTIAEYRPVYVNGDVLNPGQHAFRPSMTIRQLVALAGGYSSVRTRTATSSFDPIQLRHDYMEVAVDYTKEQIRVLRLKAELENKEDIDRSSLERAPAPLSTQADLIKSELEFLKIRQSTTQQEKAYLQRAIAQADEQIVVLKDQSQQEERGTQADTDELDRVSKLYGTGNLPSPRVTESRRAVLLSSTRRLQTTVNLMAVVRERDELRWKLEKVDSERKTNLWREMKDASAEAAKLGAKLDGIAERLRLLGSTRGFSGAGDVFHPEVTIIRKQDASISHIPAAEDVELAPGDVVEIVLKSDVVAGLGTQ
jgi:polysaccharide export outer membrane protein